MDIEPVLISFLVFPFLWGSLTWLPNAASSLLIHFSTSKNLLIFYFVASIIQHGTGTGIRLFQPSSNSQSSEEIDKERVHYIWYLQCGKKNIHCKLPATIQLCITSALGVRYDNYNITNYIY